MLPACAALLLTLTQPQDSPVPPPQARLEGWSHDLDAWLAALEREHYVFQRQGIPEALYAAADELRARIEAYSDQRMLTELQKLACLAGDGHTYVLPFAPRVTTTALPLRLYLFADGWFVIDASAPLERCLGAELLALGPVPASELEARLAPWVSRDAAQGVRWVGPVFATLTGVLEGLGVERAAERVPVRLRMRDGTETTIDVAPEPPAPMSGIPKLIPSRLPGAPPPPLYLENVPRAHDWRLLEGGTLYAQFNQVMDAPEGTLADYAAALGKALDEHRPEQFVIDVRHNNGGNSTLLSPLVAQMQRFEREHPDGRLVVLMGRNTFSAAQIFLARADHETNALFAGEPSSSRPNFVGEENEFVLPWSGAPTSISNRYHETIPGDTRDSIPPDLPLVLSSQDYFANRDPLLQRVLAR